MNPVRKTPQKRNSSLRASSKNTPAKRTRSENTPLKIISQATDKSCSITLNRATVENFRMNTSCPNIQIDTSSPQQKRARKSFQNSLSENVTQQVQSIQNVLLESMYENQMNKSIDGLVSSMKMTFKENLAAFIASNEVQIEPHVYRNELAKLKKEHSQELADMKAGYMAMLEQVKRERDSAVEDAKKKQWCPGCGKGTKHQMMMYCNTKCQKIHL